MNEWPKNMTEQTNKEFAGLAGCTNKVQTSFYSF